MSVAVAAAINFAKRRVIDTPSGYRFSDEFFLDGINQGISAMIELHPAIFGENLVIPLVPGVLQTIPEGAETYIEVSRNMGPTGETPGASVRAVDGAVLTASQPDWSSAPASAVVKHAFGAVGSLRHFYVFPPQPDTAPNHVELWASKHPGEVGGVNDTIDGLQSRHASTLGNYAAFFVLSADRADPGNETLANTFYANFVSLLRPPAPQNAEG